MTTFLVGALAATGALLAGIGLRRRPVVYGGRLTASVDSEGLLAQVARRSRMSDADLKVLGLSRRDQTALNLRWAGIGGVMLPVCVVVLTVNRVSLGPALFVGLSLVGAIAIYMWAQVAVADDANERRDEYRRELLTFISLVSMLLSGAGAVESAMRQVADMFEGELFEGIRQAMDEGNRSSGSPWTSLLKFAEDREIKVLMQLASALEQAATAGAPLEELLANKVKDGRDLALIEAQAAGDVANEKMTPAMAALTLGCMLFAIFPMIQGLIAS